MVALIQNLKTHDAADAEGILELKVSIADTVTARQAAVTELAAIERKTPEALELDDDFAEVDNLDRRRLTCARTIARCDAVLPRLNRRLDAAHETRRQRRAVDHRTLVARAYDNLRAALAAALKANDAASQAFTAAQEELGPTAGQMVPNATFSSLRKELIEHWSAAIEEALGRQPRRTMAQPRGMLVRILATSASAFGNGAAATYQRGDMASFAPDEAKRLVDLKQAEFADAADATAFPPDPRRAAPPEPDSAGRVGLIFMRAARGADGAAYALGDMADFEVDEAVHLVRSGAAEFVDGTTVEIIDKPAGSRLDARRSTGKQAK